MRIIEDFEGRSLIEIEVGNRPVRVFPRPWPHWLPFAWRRYGLIAFGAGPIGVNVFRARRPAPVEEPNDAPT